MKKYSLLAVFLLLMCNVSVCGQTGRILFVDTTFIEKTNLQRIHHSPIYYFGNPVLKADKKWELNINGDPYALHSAVAYGMMKKNINSRCGILPVAGSY